MYVLGLGASSWRFECNMVVLIQSSIRIIKYVIIIEDCKANKSQFLNTCKSTLKHMREERRIHTQHFHHFILHFMASKFTFFHFVSFGHSAVLISLMCGQLFQTFFLQPNSMSD